MPTAITTTTLTTTPQTTTTTTTATSTHINFHCDVPAWVNFDSAFPVSVGAQTLLSLLESFSGSRAVVVVVVVVVDCCFGAYGAHDMPYYIYSRGCAVCDV
jgi:hypothetical protein